MTAKTKSILILLSTLVIGFVSGASVTGYLFRERLEYVRSFVSPEGFVLRFSDLMEPLTEEQEQAVRPLLEKAGAEIDELVSTTGRDFSAIVDQLEEDLSAHLTDEQLRELRRRRRETRNRYLGSYTIHDEDDIPYHEE